MERTIFVYTNSPEKAQLVNEDLIYNALSYREIAIDVFYDPDITTTIQEFREWVYLHGDEIKHNNLTLYRFPVNLLYERLQLKTYLSIKKKTQRLVEAINEDNKSEIIKEFVEFYEDIEEYIGNYFIYVYDSPKYWEMHSDFKFANHIIQDRDHLDYIYFYQSFKFSV